MESAGSNHSLTAEERRQQVMVGNLPNDFLRIQNGILVTGTSQEEQDRSAAIHLQNQIMAQARQPIVGRLEVMIISASLNKNYGLTRMDPYVRLSIGRHVYETPTAQNGAKNPHWRKTFQIYNLAEGEKTMHLEVFDENTITEDERIAWTFVDIPECVYKGDPVSEWFKLSGKLGEDKEGTIYLSIAYTTGPAPMAPTFTMVPGYGAGYTPALPVYTMPPAINPYGVPQNFGVAQTHPYPGPPQQRQPQPPQISLADVKQLQEMFPKIDEEVIHSVLEASNGDKEFAINSLLQME